MKSNNIILDKSMEFAIRIVKLDRYLKEKEFVLSKQILRSGTSIGANVNEAVYGQSRKDFAAKMGIALKEASETRYWLTLMYRTDILCREEYESISSDCEELIKLLTSIVRSASGET